jgi:hypothetical protein
MNWYGSERKPNLRRLGYEVVTTVTVERATIWDVTSCSLALYRCLRETCGLHLQSRRINKGLPSAGFLLGLLSDPEDGGSSSDMSAEKTVLYII